MVGDSCRVLVKIVAGKKAKMQKKNQIKDIKISWTFSLFSQLTSPVGDVSSPRLTLLLLVFWLVLLLMLLLLLLPKMRCRGLPAGGETRVRVQSQTAGHGASSMAD